MQIDWLTVTAQILNFLVLIWLLKRFLYRRVLDALAHREQRIRNQFTQAEHREAEATRMTQHYETLRTQLEQVRTEQLAQARRDADDIREQLREKARSEVTAQRERWLADFDHEREQIIAQTRHQIARQVAQATRQALVDLADVELEQQAVRVLLRRLHALDDDERNELAALMGDEPLTVSTSFDLSTALRDELTAAIRQLLNSESIQFIRSDDDGFGLALSVGGRTLGWSVAEYLLDLERDLDQAMRSPHAPG